MLVAQKAGQLSVTVARLGLLEQNAGQSSVGVASDGDEEAAGKVAPVLEEAAPPAEVLDDIVWVPPPKFFAGTAHVPALDCVVPEHPAPPDGRAAAFDSTDSAMLTAAMKNTQAAASNCRTSRISRASVTAIPQ